MSDRIRLLLVGFRRFSELIGAVKDEFAAELDITMIDSLASGAVDYQALVEQHAPDIVASAGANAAYLAATLDLPVISQPVTESDLIHGLARARRIDRCVHLFSYARHAPMADALLESASDLLDMEVIHHSYSTSDEAKEALLLAFAEKPPKVVLGPSYICHEAEQRGASALLVYSRASARALLQQAVDRALQERASGRVTPAPRPERFVIRSPQMERVASLAKTYARGRGAVLVQGESGTGKEHIAREIHRLSDYAGGPVIAVNCGSIPNELFESELFGYVEGAFTSSRRGGRSGLMEQANGGVLFLDEVGEMPGPQQVKLLRALQEQRIRPVGGNREIPLDFKLIAATNRDLRDAVARGDFRDDLYYRLNVFTLRLPALRDRPEDILAIARYYAETYARHYTAAIDPDRLVDAVAEHFLAYPWPGNVRELQNFIERLVVNCIEATQDRVVNEGLGDVLPELFLPLDGIESGQVLKSQETAAIREAMLRFNGDRQRVAEYLGISATTLWRRLKDMDGLADAARSTTAKKRKNP